MLQTTYEKRSNRKPSRTLAAGAQRRFLAPAKRRSRDQEVERIVEVAQEGRFPPQLYPAAAAVGFGPEDLMRLPLDVAAGVAEAQEAMAAGPPKLRRNLMSLIEACGIQDLLRRHPRDVLAALGMAAAQASFLSYQRGIRCHEAAAGEEIGWASAEVTAVEAQRAINTGSRAADTVLRAQLAGVRLQTETARAEKAGVPSEALRDEEWRGKKLSQEFLTYRASQIDISQPCGEEAERQRREAAQAANRNATPCTVSEGDTASEGRTAWSERRHPAGSHVGEKTTMPAGSRRSGQDSTEADAAADGQEAANRSATPYTVSEGGTAWSERRHPAGSYVGDETTMPAGSRRSDQETNETEGEEAANRHASPYTVSDDDERASEDTLEIIGGNDMATATGDAEVPAALSLPLAERRAEAAEALRALDSAAAADDPADSWEAEVLAIAVKTGKASASIVARFVEQASTVPIFPEPGMANRARPPMHHYLERLSPRGWPRVTATGSSSISLMGAP